jgi:hypothetical protein
VIGMKELNHKRRPADGHPPGHNIVGLCVITGAIDNDSTHPRSIVEQRHVAASPHDQAYR